MTREVVKEDRRISDIEQGLLTQKQVAKWLNVSVHTVKDWRINGKGPNCVRTGGKLVRYRSCDVAEWLERQTVKLNGSNDV